jgi:glycosyltransferase involved in cell wall biosynthesis
MICTKSVRPIRVFVHLAHGFGAESWRARWSRGEIIGINERLPYGYFRAREDGCTVEYSEDRAEHHLAKCLRLAVRLVLGFDLVHAWRNRRGIRNAEVVWTHTESQYLAVLFLLCTRKGVRHPKIIAQTIWLFDHWHKLSGPRRWLYACLIRRADVLTVHSPRNLKFARELFPDCRSELVPFGIRADTMLPRGPRPAHRPIRVLSLGNDRHRDWATLIRAVTGRTDCVLRIVSHSVNRALLRSAANIEIMHPRNNSELSALYEWADIVVVPLQPNLHASGITVVQEATLYGLPVICTDTGGLNAYFSDGEVSFVPPRDPEVIRQQIATLAADDAGRWEMIERARQRIISSEHTSRRYAQRHAELSRELLSGAATESRVELACAGKNARRVSSNSIGPRLGLCRWLAAGSIVAAVSGDLVAGIGRRSALR